MAITLETLREEAGAGTSAKATRQLTSALTEADLFVQTYLTDNLDADAVYDVPTEIVDKAILVTAVDLYHQSQAPNGVINEQYDVGDGTVTSTPIRISRDPLRGARQVLELWIGPAFA